ncbi:hypothetical protein BDV32DRAFT_147518 [Aspergillus pseudonomiae]|uniref:Uncharacterized protein n=1 Tax=Aspergillus pseudonomiae TaxID=1506151 RepID=A0A5N7CW68_9EURO|nr:uncharacterized protein BDV37DRAFT_288511 [Aspergillus pseudonomiae]KAB8262597.1 hypothetical protein BDV32DRAFT_147518 [Aspergillus pseudonomiae]KAE8398445.1 hypothetical protein BDV37DRAFT_288511 [Aspergillus pseudonomiae]
MNDTLRTRPDVVQTSSKIPHDNDGTYRQNSARRLRFQLWSRVKQYAPFGTTGKSRARQLAASQASPCLPEISTKHSDKVTITSEKHEQLGTSRCNASIPDGRSRFINTVKSNPTDSLPAPSPNSEKSKIISTAKSPTNPFNAAILHPVSGPLILPSQAKVASVQLSPPTSKCQDALPKTTKTDTEGSIHPVELFAVSAEPETTSPPPVPPKSPRTMDRSPKLQQEQCTFISPWRDLPTSNHGRYVASDPLGTKPPYMSQAVHHCNGPYRFHSGGALLGRRFPSEHNSPSNREGQRHTKAEDASPEVRSAYTLPGTPQRIRGIHVRYQSDTSVMQRGRSTRTNGTTSRNPNKGYFSTERRACFMLPLAVAPSGASPVFSPNEIECLHPYAKHQAEAFKALNCGEVRALSLELRVLEERCKQIRRIYNSLEFELRGLQERTTRLLGSQSTDFAECRKNVLIRTKAMADLNVSMKGWASKLEQATDQQVYLRQKLARHVAATSLRDTTNPGLGLSDEPDHGTNPVMTSNLVDTSRRKTESIKVYADLNVFEEIATLAEPERQMELTGFPTKETSRHGILPF